MELDTYEAPQLVSLGSAKDLVQWSWTGDHLEWVLAWFTPCSGEEVCPVE